MLDLAMQKQKLDVEEGEEDLKRLRERKNQVKKKAEREIKEKLNEVKGEREMLECVLL